MAILQLFENAIDAREELAKEKERMLRLLIEFDGIQEGMSELEEHIEEVEDDCDYIKKNLLVCQKCGAKFRKIKEYQYQPTCAHFPEKWVLNVG